MERACVTAEAERLRDRDGDGIPDFFEQSLTILIQVKTIRNQSVTITPFSPSICPDFPPTPVCPAAPCGEP